MSCTRFTSILFAVVVVVVVGAAGLSAPANAQGGSNQTPRDPGDPKAAVPPLRYDSAFARYRSNAEVEVGAWREANDNVGRIGGWRVYGRETISEPKADEQPAAAGRSEGGAAPKPDHGHPQRGPR